MLADNNSFHAVAPVRSLVVFSDDWGRHPSSCQHLIRQLLPRYRVLWVNTIGTRAPRLNAATLNRVAEKLRSWIGSPARREGPSGSSGSTIHENLQVVNPRMWPWFSRPADRRLNAWLLSRQLTPLIRELPGPVHAVTTLPITADLPDRLPVDRWLYYCVDDFAEWPGLDGGTLRRMDTGMVQQADQIVAVSQHLQELIAAQGRSSSLLTHGVDMPHWSQEATEIPAALSPFETGARAVFWGVVDRRLNSEMLLTLSDRMKNGNIILAGPQQDPDPVILKRSNIHAIGPQPFSDLPAIAQFSDVLMMPYSDLPVTRAMQPLKMKEYLATGRPVVVSDLPAVRAWNDCMDVTVSPEDFAATVLNRLDAGLSPAQFAARQRLNLESWACKADQLESHFLPTEASELCVKSPAL